LPGLQWIIDPDDAPLALSEANGVFVLSPAKFKPATKEKIWASNIDTEGEKAAGSKVSNAQLGLELRMVGATEEQFRLRQVALEQKLHKLGEEGGILRIIHPDEGGSDWEIRDIQGGEKLLDNAYLHSRRVKDELTFILASYGEGEEELMGEYEFGEAKRILECVVPDVKGSELANARAVVTSPEADIWDLKWGLESRDLSLSPTAKALYAASELTPLGGATATTATVEGQAGVSVVRQGTLTSNWTAMLTTGQLTHIGVYEVLVWVHMPTGNTGEIGLGFEYSNGDPTNSMTLDPIYFAPNHPREGKVIQLSLGQVFLRPSGNGGHFWEGRVISKSSVIGDDLDILDFGLRPLAEGNGSVSQSPIFSQPAALSIRDDFNQASGNLNGKTLAANTLTSGPKSPVTVASDASAGSAAWTNPSNAKASDNSYATATGNFVETQYLKATNFGFAIPEGATIIGIVGEVERHASEKGTGYNIAWLYGEKIVKANAIKTEASKGHHLFATMPTTDTIETCGGSSDLWGQSWTPADINNSGFGFAFQAWIQENLTVFIDQVRLTVYYTTVTGETWATSGDAVDLAVEETGHTAQRTEVNDANIDTGRYAVAGTTAFTDSAVGISCKRNPLTISASDQVRQGALARYVDNSNWLMASFHDNLSINPVTYEVRVVKRVAGTATQLASLTVTKSYEWKRLWLTVDQNGRWCCWGMLTESGIPQLLLAGQEADLAPGGALASGKAGFYDAKIGSNAVTRNYDQFVAWVPPLLAVIYEGLALELTHDACRREVESGGTWADVTPSGDFLKLAPAALEGRSNRLVFIASPNDPETMGLGAIPKKLKVAIYATPRHRTIPDPA